MRQYLGYTAIIIGIIIFISVLYINNGYNGVTRPFSNYTLLTSSWEKYKRQFINGDGRVIDYGNNSLTTSEGQSYALLRAVWVDDKQAFDQIWKWTRENLKRPGDYLFGWRWGKKPDGSFGFLSGGGNNSASDADTDIALALILADRRWHVTTYDRDAQNILGDIWGKEVATVSGNFYVTAGNWAQNDKEVVINPSYFAPYAWRIFAQTDKKPEHRWNDLIGPAYGLLEEVSRDPLDKSVSAGLPPDWIVVDRTTGKPRAPDIPSLTTNYSFDAMRIPWRIALDWEWNHEPQALSYLQNNFGRLLSDFNHNGKLATSYAHDGTVLNGHESPAMYATAIGYFLAVHPLLAKRIYDEKIVRLYSNDTNSFNSELPYYDQNWLWFGAALYAKALDHY